MTDPVTMIGIVFGVIAVLYGLISRNFRTALVAGLLVGLVHAGLVALLAMKANAPAANLPFAHNAIDLLMRARDVPYLKGPVDFVMQSPYLAPPPAKLASYLIGGALLLMLTLIVLYIVKAILAAFVSLFTPKKA